MFLGAFTEELMNFHSRPQLRTRPPTCSQDDYQVAFLPRGLETQETDRKPRVPIGSRVATWVTWERKSAWLASRNIRSAPGFARDLLRGFGQATQPPSRDLKVLRQ